jgi:hypothetical protein
MSDLGCPNRTHALQQKPLLNQFVGRGKQPPWQLEAKRLGRSRMLRGLCGLVGESQPMHAIFRQLFSLRISNRLAIKSVATFEKPVIFPPRLARLSTSLFAIGTGTTTNTIGIVVVARLAIAGSRYCDQHADLEPD